MSSETNIYPNPANAQQEVPVKGKRGKSMFRFRNLSPRQRDLLQKGAIGVGGAAAAGAVFLGLTSFANADTAGTLSASDHTGDHNEPLIHQTAPLASSVNDSMSFGQAFAAARNEVGPGGHFSWHGIDYNTYYREEWEGMSSTQRDQFTASLNGAHSGEPTGVAASDPVEIPTDAHMAHGVNDQMSFGLAFATAREEVGPGGFFIWNGNTYNTFQKEEWEQMNEHQKAEFFAHVEYSTDWDSAHPTTEVSVLDDQGHEVGTQYLHLDDAPEGIVVTDEDHSTADAHLTPSELHDPIVIEDGTASDHHADVVALNEPAHDLDNHSNVGDFMYDASLHHDNEPLA